MTYRLLTEFERLFRGQPYFHRRSNQGDVLAAQFYEDLLALDKVPRLAEEIQAGVRVINNGNELRGVKARRGDGTFGEIVPGLTPIEFPGFAAKRGQVATIEIGVEVKILAKAMLKQIDRVASDLQHQSRQFRQTGRPVCVAIVGINYAEVTRGYEGNRSFTTDGRANKHPVQEAAAAEEKLLAEAKPLFDEFLVVRYRATNMAPFPFNWLNSRATELDYAAALTRVARLWEQRFAA
jgi:hypothetical protein